MTVNAVVSQAPTPGPSETDLFAKNVRDVFFNFDKADIRPDEAPIASGDAAFLQQHPGSRFWSKGIATTGVRRNTTSR